MADFCLQVYTWVLSFGTGSRVYCTNIRQLCNISASLSSTPTAGPPCNLSFNAAPRHFEQLPPG